MAKYSPEIIKRCAEWVSKNGLIDDGGARLIDFLSFLNIDQKTYYNWLKKSEFSDTIKRAKNTFRDTLEIDLVKSLARCAKGYAWEQTMTEYTDSDGKPKIKKQTKKNIEEPPNVGAAIFLLTNINPQKWQNRSKSNIEADVNMKESIDYSNLSDEDLKLAYVLIQKAADGKSSK